MRDISIVGGDHQALLVTALSSAVLDLNLPRTQTPMSKISRTALTVKAARLTPSLPNIALALNGQHVAVNSNGAPRIRETGTSVVHGKLVGQTQKP